MTINAINPNKENSQNPHIYISLFNHLHQNIDYVHCARMGQEEMMKFDERRQILD